MSSRRAQLIERGARLQPIAVLLVLVNLAMIGTVTVVLADQVWTEIVHLSRLNVLQVRVDYKVPSKDGLGLRDEQPKYGTAFVISKNGIAATAAHNLPAASDSPRDVRISVRRGGGGDGTWLRAELVDKLEISNADKLQQVDAAILKISQEPTTGGSWVSFCFMDEIVPVGTELIGFGYTSPSIAEPVPPLKTTFGHASSSGGPGTTSTLALNVAPGFSGGPVLTRDGRVAGMTRAGTAGRPEGFMQPSANFAKLRASYTDSVCGPAAYSWIGYLDAIAREIDRSPTLKMTAGFLAFVLLLAILFVGWSAGSWIRTRLRLRNAIKNVLKDLKTARADLSAKLPKAPVQARQSVTDEDISLLHVVVSTLYHDADNSNTRSILSAFEKSGPGSNLLPPFVRGWLKHSIRNGDSTAEDLKARKEALWLARRTDADVLIWGCQRQDETVLHAACRHKVDNQYRNVPLLSFRDLGHALSSIAGREEFDDETLTADGSLAEKRKKFREFIQTALAVCVGRLSVPYLTNPSEGTRNDVTAAAKCLRPLVDGSNGIFSAEQVTEWRDLLMRLDADILECEGNDSARQSLLRHSKAARDDAWKENLVTIGSLPLNGGSLTPASLLQMCRTQLNYVDHLGLAKVPSLAEDKQLEIIVDELEKLPTTSADPTGTCLKARLHLLAGAVGEDVTAERAREHAEKARSIYDAAKDLEDISIKTQAALIAAQSLLTEAIWTAEPSKLTEVFDWLNNCDFGRRENQEEQARNVKWVRRRDLVAEAICRCSGHLYLARRASSEADRQRSIEQRADERKRLQLTGTAFNAPGGRTVFVPKFGTAVGAKTSRERDYIDELEDAKAALAKLLNGSATISMARTPALWALLTIQMANTMSLDTGLTRTSSNSSTEEELRVTRLGLSVFDGQIEKSQSKKLWADCQECLAHKLSNAWKFTRSLQYLEETLESYQEAAAALEPNSIGWAYSTLRVAWCYIEAGSFAKHVESQNALENGHLGLAAAEQHIGLVKPLVNQRKLSPNHRLIYHQYVSYWHLVSSSMVQDEREALMHFRKAEQEYKIVRELAGRMNVLHSPDYTMAVLHEGIPRRREELEAAMMREEQEDVQEPVT